MGAAGNAGAARDTGSARAIAAARNVALVPLRGGSKSIPRKNIKPIAGRPLCAWVLEAASRAERIESVFVSTDCPEIEAVVAGLELDVEIVHRPPELATDESSTEAVMLHFLQRVPEFDRLVTIQATSPLLEARDLDQALADFDAGGCDSLLSAVRVKRFFWRDDGTPLNYEPAHRPRRQEFDGTLMENGAFYITTKQLLARAQCRLGGRIGIHEMAPESAVEIDEPEDWEIVARLLERRREAQGGEE